MLNLQLFYHNSSSTQIPCLKAEQPLKYSPCSIGIQASVLPPHLFKARTQGGRPARFGHQSRLNRETNREKKCQIHSSQIPSWSKAHSIQHKLLCSPTCSPPHEVPRDAPSLCTPFPCPWATRSCSIPFPAPLLRALPSNNACPKKPPRISRRATATKQPCYARHPRSPAKPGDSPVRPRQ